MYTYSFNSFLPMPPVEFMFYTWRCQGWGRFPAPASFKAGARHRVGLGPASEEGSSPSDFIRVVGSDQSSPLDWFPVQGGILKAKYVPTDTFWDNVLKSKICGQSLKIRFYITIYSPPSFVGEK